MLQFKRVPKDLPGISLQVRGGAFARAGVSRLSAREKDICEENSEILQKHLRG